MEFYHHHHHHHYISSEYQLSSLEASRTQRDTYCSGSWRDGGKWNHGNQKKVGSRESEESRIMGIRVGSEESGIMGKNGWKDLIEKWYQTAVVGNYNLSWEERNEEGILECDGKKEAELV